MSLRRLSTQQLRNLVRTAVLLTTACFTTWCAVAGESMGEPEARVKAMFLYNFARFTTWPAEVKGPVTFCVAGEDRLDRELEPLLQGKLVAYRTVAVRHLASLAQIGDCRVIYIGRSERNRTPQIVRSVLGRSVLVVSEYPEAGRRGAAINFFMEHDKMRFAINLAAAGDAGVTLSSTLLRLARITEDGN